MHALTRIKLDAEALQVSHQTGRPHSVFFALMPYAFYYYRTNAWQIDG